MKGTEKEWYLSLRSRKERKGVDGNGIVVAAKIPPPPRKRTGPQMVQILNSELLFPNYLPYFYTFQMFILFAIDKIN